MSASRIHRYITKEVIVPATLGLFVLTFIIMMGRLPKLVELIVNKGVPVSEILRLFAYMLPSFFALTIPMALLLGILLGFGRLSAESEIVAIKASGLGLYGILRPVLLLGLAASLLTGYLTLSAEPASRGAFRDLLFNIASSRASIGIQSGVFNDDFDGLVVYAGHVDERSDKMTGVFISDERPGQTPSIIFARHGRILSDPKARILTLQLNDGTIHRQPQGRETSSYQVIDFNTYDINLNLGQGLDSSANRLTKRGEMTMAELGAIRDKLPPGPKRNLYIIEIYQRIVLPFAPFLFVLLGVPLGIQSNRSGKGAGFAMALTVFMTYYMVLSLAKTLGIEGVIPPLVAIWIPDVLFLLAGVYFLHLAAMEKRIVVLDWAGEMLSRVKKRFRRRGGGGGTLKLVNRYILNSFVRVLLLALGAFVSIYLLIDFFEKVNDFINNSAPLSLYLLYFLNKIPQVATQIIPVAILMATFMTLGGLSRTNELTAMRSCGISLWRVATPLLVSAFFLSLAVLAVNEYVVPITAKKTNDILAFRNEHAGAPLQRDKIWFRDGNDIVNIRLAYPEKGQLEGISIFEIGPAFRPGTRIEAQSASYAKGGWQFKKVTVRHFSPSSGELVKVEHFGKMPFPLHKRPKDFKALTPKKNELGYRQLHRLARQLHAEGYDATRYRVDMYSRLATPFACLIMAFLGIPFALQKGRGASLTAGIAISVVIGFSFYIVQAMLLAFGYSGVFPPLVAAWAADALFFLLGLWLVLSVRE